MNRPANLSAAVIIEYETSRRDYECEVEVDYTYNGSDVKILGYTVLGGDDYTINTDWFEQAVWDAVNDEAPEAYQEWLADYGEYLRDQAMDREFVA